mgnify:CR=1 FL=1
MTAIILDRKFLQSVEDMIMDILASFEDEMVTALVDSKGLTYGDLELSREERMMKFLDDESIGVNEELATSDPEEASRRQRDFMRDAEDSGVV